MDHLSRPLAAVDELIASLEAFLPAEDTNENIDQGQETSSAADEGLGAIAPVRPAPDAIDKQKKPKAQKASKAPALPPLPEAVVQFHSCDLRVGRVVEVGHHPEADGLFALKIDVGAGEVRTVCAGLRKYVTDAEMEGRKVVLICNLKPRKLRGIDSEAMCLAGSVVSSTGEKDVVVPVAPPEGSEAGDVVFVNGMDGDRNVTDGKHLSSKIWEKVVPRLSVKQGKACYDGHPMSVRNGYLLCALPDGAEIH